MFPREWQADLDRMPAALRRLLEAELAAGNTRTKLSRGHFGRNHRPFFLRFHTEDRAEREQAYRELCGRLGVDPAKPVNR